MQLEMLNVLWMRKILLLDIIARVVLFPVMNLVLVLVVAVVSRPHAEIRQFNVLGVFGLEFGERDFAVLVHVEHVEDGLYDHLFLGFADAGRGGVGEAVGAADVGRGPYACAVVVVEVEEGGCVEAGDVVLLCLLLACTIITVKQVLSTSHMPSRPVCIWRNNDLRVVAATMR